MFYEDEISRLNHIISPLVQNGQSINQIYINHQDELIRRVLPKGSSFNSLTQDDINLMMNQINSYKRKKLNNPSPYETFRFYHGEEVLHKFGCHPVAAGDIMLKPALLKK